MPKFKQFEYIVGEMGLGRILTITGSKYQVNWIQQENKFNDLFHVVDMSQNYPLNPVANPTIVRPLPDKKIQTLNQWLDINSIDSNYVSAGFEYETVYAEFLKNKGFKNA